MGSPETGPSTSVSAFWLGVVPTCLEPGGQRAELGVSRSHEPQPGFLIAVALDSRPEACLHVAPHGFGGHFFRCQRGNTSTHYLVSRFIDVKEEGQQAFKLT